MANGLNFKVKGIYKLEGDGKLKAFVDLVINDEILIKGLRVVKGKEDLFVSMPREQGKDGKWYDTIRPLNKGIMHEITTVALSAYNEEK
ncbi:MAG: septation protein SpoVG family protein [Candidatus Omnitrophota bacterium]